MKPFKCFLSRDSDVNISSAEFCIFLGGAGGHLARHKRCVRQFESGLIVAARFRSCVISRNMSINPHDNHSDALVSSSPTSRKGGPLDPTLKPQVLPFYLPCWLRKILSFLMRPLVNSHELQKNCLFFPVPLILRTIFFLIILINYINAISTVLEKSVFICFF